MLRKTVFIADLHLSEAYPAITEAFLAFLTTLDDRVDALYILGDFFELWVGDDYQTPFTKQIAAALKRVADKGIHTYFLHGNRDFLLGKQYAEQAGFTLLNEQTVIDLYGTPTLLLHGDEMCTQDIAYQKFRKKSRGWWWPKLMLATPLWYRQRVAKKARQKSKESQAMQSLEILDVTEQAVLDTFAKHQVNVMIHGHTHRPNTHLYQQKNQPLKRIVLGDWYEQGTYLIATSDGALTLHTAHR